MTGKRNFGSVAAIGGMTAAVVLLTGLPAAKADELSDLRANQQLLQQRIDQLAQAQAQGGPPSHLGAPGMTGPVAYGTRAVPGQPLAGGSFPRSFLIPGTDTSIRVGGFVSEVLDYWIQNGPPNGTQTTTVGDNGNALGAGARCSWPDGSGRLWPEGLCRAGAAQPFARQRHLLAEPA